VKASGCFKPVVRASLFGFRRRKGDGAVAQNKAFSISTPIDRFRR
jgi:hypothetical protein